ncbi:tetracycline resistance element mobilization regulatory protein rteC [Aquipluma nitroreducens]|uniref:Tetracycline resistance element mobilization regulatory protein rteC n=1 Tax=Aquipluma nitroreducens TaxID=2010828 RepID=A0A5K7S3U1_9BACT|nr:RteC domain-containing protein [Aquipluma nitroreducens]BBE16145.1 tetracycline resistance element mobilization regulatory protein rteC [Aquipluma nitroreducens]
MIEYIANLKKEVDAKIELIESSEENILKRSLAGSQVLGEAFNRLKVFVLAYTFKDEEEEIIFFKDIKPKFCYRLIYYRKIYNIEMNRPMAGVDAQKVYLNKELNAINRYTTKRLDFIRYYRSGSTHLDSLYFLRGKLFTEQYLETFYYELDPVFCTICDFKVAKILANDMLLPYLMQELELLDNSTSKLGSFYFPSTKLTWKGTKTELMEQLYSWDTASTFGNVPLTQLSDYIQNVFNIRLDKNLSRAFSDMKIRTNPTPFLDKLKNALLRRMGRNQ